MARASIRIRINNDGGLEVVDPGFDSLSLMKSIDPGFRIRRAKLPGFTTPKFLRTRNFGCSIPIKKIHEESEDVLWDIHAEKVRSLNRREVTPEILKEEASLLDLKIEISRRILSKCRLCGNRCGVNRLQGEVGVCGLGIKGRVGEHFIHISEEAPINPSLIISLAECGLRCRFCQQRWLINMPLPFSENLGAELWSKLDKKGARSLSFAGGNPDESLYDILCFLKVAPKDWRLPVVWNCNGFATFETIMLLDAVVDVYLPDFKFGNKKCGRLLSVATDYPDVAKKAIFAMLDQGVPVILRILVLPGHFECCHKPALDFLASLNANNLFISIRGQYCPDGEITHLDSDLNRRPTHEEIERVRNYVEKIGLSLII